jgi:hypothetical protein
MRAIVVPVKGPIEVVEIEKNSDDIREVVGGWIEMVQLIDWPHSVVHAYINEDGKFKKLPHNIRATQMASLFPGDFIAGNMIILGTKGPEETDVPDHVLEDLGLKG